MIKYRGLEIAAHCDAGQPEIVKTKEYVYMGTDWEIRCPCGHKKRYTWVQAYYAIRLWNEEVTGVADRSLR